MQDDDTVFSLESSSYLRGSLFFFALLFVERLENQIIYAALALTRSCVKRDQCEEGGGGVMIDHIVQIFFFSSWLAPSLSVGLRIIDSFVSEEKKPFLFHFFYFYTYIFLWLYDSSIKRGEEKKKKRYASRIYCAASCSSSLLSSFFDPREFPPVTSSSSSSTFFQPFKRVPFDFFVFYSSSSFFIAAAVHCLIVLL